jgi:hypothetical protein
MSMRGFFKMDYSGANSAGSGAIAFIDGKVAGIDVGGGIYDGSYSEAQPGVLSGKVNVSFPEGGTLVTGQIAPRGSAISVPFRVANSEIEGHTIQLQTPTGPVAVKLTKVSSL